MKLTVEQLDKAAQAIKEAHHEYHPTMDDYRDMATAAFAVIEPEQVNIPGDLLEKAIAAGQKACGLNPNADHWNRAYTAAALESALSDPRVMGDPTEAEWKAYTAHTPASDPAHARICATIFAPRRHRLLSPQRLNGFVPLEECPIGLFISGSGELCLKTEYGLDAYIARSGEKFWGGAKSAEALAKVYVRPVVQEPSEIVAKLNGGR